VKILFKKGGNMQRRSLGVLVGLMIAMMLVTVSCQKQQTQSTSPDTPDVEVTETMAQEETAGQEVIDQEAIEAENVRREQERLRSIFISENIYFEFDDASLTPMAQEVLRSKAVWMQNSAETGAIIEGHCDERGTAEYNLALGDRRAQGVKSFLVDLGIASNRLTTISYGEEMPVDPRADEEAWSKNRRAQFTIK
jgi:peptidoglycan-associated lipoprotein